MTVYQQATIQGCIYLCLCDKIKSIQLLLRGVQCRKQQQDCVVGIGHDSTNALHNQNGYWHRLCRNERAASSNKGCSLKEQSRRATSGSSKKPTELFITTATAIIANITTLVFLLSRAFSSNSSYGVLP